MLDLLDDDAVRRAALGLDPESSRRDFPMEVGEVLVFDGRLWHAFHAAGRGVSCADSSTGSCQGCTVRRSSPDGGIGRRRGLKPPGWQHHVGSSPTPGTSLGQSNSLLYEGSMSAASASAADRPWWQTAMTCSVMGM